MQTTFFVIETEPGYYLCSDGETSQVLDEAQVFRTKAEARKHLRHERAIREIECRPGKETFLGAEVS